MPISSLFFVSLLSLISLFYKQTYNIHINRHDWIHCYYYSEKTNLFNQLRIRKVRVFIWPSWVSVNSGSWWWTGRPGVLQFMGSRRVGHNWETDLIWSSLMLFFSPLFFSLEKFFITWFILRRQHIPSILFVRGNLYLFCQFWRIISQSTEF